MKKLTKEENNLKLNMDFSDFSERAKEMEKTEQKRRNTMNYYRALVDQGKMSLSEYVKIINQ